VASEEKRFLIRQANRTRIIIKELNNIIPHCERAIDVSEDILIGLNSVRNDLIHIHNKFDRLARKFDAIISDEYIASKTVEHFIQSEVSLLHFVFTNDKSEKIRPTGIDGYYFSCPFHNEKTPSFRVLNKNNSCMCYGCHFGFRDDYYSSSIYGDAKGVILYLMAYEDITQEEAIALIAKVYALDITVEIEPKDELVRKYTDSLLSPEYKNLLLSSLEKMKGMMPSLERDEHMAFLEKQLYAIERVEDNIISMPNRKLIMKPMRKKHYYIESDLPF